MSQIMKLDGLHDINLTEKQLQVPKQNAEQCTMWPV